MKILIKQSYVSRTALMKSESETHWMTHYLKNETNENFRYNEKIKEDEYECSSKDFVDEDLVKNLI
jgi:hypothetical protein